VELSPSWGATNCVATQELPAFYGTRSFNTVIKRSSVRVSDELDFFNLPNPSSWIMAWGSTQPLREMSTRNLRGGKVRPARKVDKLTAICEPQPLATLRASTTCTGTTLPLSFTLTFCRLSHCWMDSLSNYFLWQYNLFILLVFRSSSTLQTITYRSWHTEISFSTVLYYQPFLIIFCVTA
jgi:hypothetical protein